MGRRKWFSYTFHKPYGTTLCNSLHPATKPLAFSSNEPGKPVYLPSCMTRHLQWHLFVCGTLHVARYFQRAAETSSDDSARLILINSTPAN